MRKEGNDGHDDHIIGEQDKKKRKKSEQRPKSRVIRPLLKTIVYGGVLVGSVIMVDKYNVGNNIVDFGKSFGNSAYEFVVRPHTLKLDTKRIYNFMDKIPEDNRMPILESYFSDNPGYFYGLLESSSVDSALSGYYSKIAETYIGSGTMSQEKKVQMIQEIYNNLPDNMQFQLFNNASEGDISDIIVENMPDDQRIGLMQEIYSTLDTGGKLAVSKYIIEDAIGLQKDE